MPTGKTRRRFGAGCRRSIRPWQHGPRRKAEVRWGDESGARSDAARQRGYAPRNEPPEQAVPGYRFRVNMISTITNEGKLRFMLYDGRMNAAVFILFLTRLLAGATRKVVLIVDHLKVHESAAVQSWLRGKEDRLEIVAAPAARRRYAWTSTSITT